jgi:predicted aspartyl protease
MRGFFLNANDHRARLRVQASGPNKTIYLTFEIDTGASRDMLIHQTLADELGLKTENDDDLATLADGTTEVAVLKATVEVVWMGESKPVNVLVWPGTVAPVRNKNTIDGLIGRDLLRDTHLTIDYVNRKILIAKPTHEGT